jgi:predicted metalloprotease with PDZ domain
VVNTLNQVVPHDWRGFWAERLTNHGPGAPLTGIERSGWKLVYNETQPELIKVLKRERKEINAEYSIGLLLEESGNVIDTVEGMPAAKAGIGPGMKVAAVNGKRFSEDALNDVLRAAKNSSDAIELLVENAEYFKIYKVDYHGGERYPHLVRDESKPDVLTEIITPR